MMFSFLGAENVFSLYGLVFLAGSYTVASLSDVRRMVAQRDFMEVWAVFAFLAFSFDLFILFQGGPVSGFFIKWALVVGLTVFLHSRIIFSLSVMDVAAIGASLSLLDPVHIVFFFVVLVVAGELLKSVLKNFGQGGAYPFLPVVLLANIAVVVAVALGGITSFL